MYNNPPPNLPDISLLKPKLQDAQVQFHPRPKGGGHILVPPHPSAIKFIAPEQLIYTGEQPGSQIDFIISKKKKINGAKNMPALSPSPY